MHSKKAALDLLKFVNVCEFETYTNTVANNSIAWNSNWRNTSRTPEAVRVSCWVINASYLTMVQVLPPLDWPEISFFTWERSFRWPDPPYTALTSHYGATTLLLWPWIRMCHQWETTQQRGWPKNDLSYILDTQPQKFLLKNIQFIASDRKHWWLFCWLIIRFNK